MNEIGKRIKQIRKDNLKMTQEAFGKSIGIASNTITSYENGSRTPSDQTILSICREYNVNENWLRSGEGEMFNDLSKGEEVANLVAKAIKNNDEFVINTFIALGKLEPKDWEIIKEYIKTIKEG